MVYYEALSAVTLFHFGEIILKASVRISKQSCTFNLSLSRRLLSEVLGEDA